MANVSALFRRESHYSINSEITVPQNILLSKNDSSPIDNMKQKNTFQVLNLIYPCIFFLIKRHSPDCIKRQDVHQKSLGKKQIRVENFPEPLSKCTLVLVVQDSSTRVLSILTTYSTSSLKIAVAQIPPIRQFWAEAVRLRARRKQLKMRMAS